MNGLATRASVVGLLAALTLAVPNVLDDLADLEVQPPRGYPEAPEPAATALKRKRLDDLNNFNQVLADGNRAARRAMLRNMGRGMIKGWRFFRLKRVADPPYRKNAAP